MNTSTDIPTSENLSSKNDFEKFDVHQQTSDNKNKMNLLTEIKQINADVPDLKKYIYDTRFVDEFESICDYFETIMDYDLVLSLDDIKPLVMGKTNVKILKYLHYSPTVFITVSDLTNYFGNEFYKNPYYWELLKLVCQYSKCLDELDVNAFEHLVEYVCCPIDNLKGDQLSELSLKLTYEQIETLIYAHKCLEFNEHFTIREFIYLVVNNQLDKAKLINEKCNVGETDIEYETSIYGLPYYELYSKSFLKKLRKYSKINPDFDPEWDEMDDSQRFIYSDQDIPKIMLDCI